MVGKIQQNYDREEAAAAKYKRLKRNGSDPYSQADSMYSEPAPTATASNADKVAARKKRKEGLGKKLFGKSQDYLDSIGE
jgi:hypothetical protein